MTTITLIVVKERQELTGLKNIPPDQIVYVINDNVFYHLTDWSRRNKLTAWTCVFGC